MDFFFDRWYPVAMYPEWRLRTSRRKGIRFLGLVLSMPWFATLLPLTACIGIACLAVDLWDEA